MLRDTIFLHLKCINSMTHTVPAHAFMTAKLVRVKHPSMKDKCIIESGREKSLTALLETCKAREM